MPESIESFVKKLQSEGIAAGEEAAEKIKQKAKREAEKILADAKAEAGNLIAEAKKNAERQLTRGQTELELAVRDAVLKLRQTINRILSTMLTRKVEEYFSNPDYLGAVIREIVKIYAGADAENHPSIEVNLPNDMAQQLRENVLHDLFQRLGDEKDSMELKDTLAEAGFEYKIHGATVEVSPDSVAALISEMVSPALQKILESVIGQGNGNSVENKPEDKSGSGVYPRHDGSKKGEGAS